MMHNHMMESQPDSQPQEVPEIEEALPSFGKTISMLHPAPDYPHDQF